MTEETRAAVASPMDGRMRTALGTVAVMGAVATVFAGLGWGLRPGISAGAGAAIAASNLYALARILGALMTSQSDVADEPPRRASVGGWAVLAVLKMTILFGGMWLLMVRGYVEALPLLVGYGSLPLGIAVGAIVSDRTGLGRS